jgi:hypothetical protein
MEARMVRYPSPRAAPSQLMRQSFDFHSTLNASGRALVGAGRPSIDTLI